MFKYLKQNTLAKINSIPNKINKLSIDNSLLSRQCSESMMLFRSLRSTWLTILFWNSVCSQLLYENNNQWNNELIIDSNEASAQLSLGRLEALLKETKLESETWRSRYEAQMESFNRLPTICKEHVHNGSFNFSNSNF